MKRRGAAKGTGSGYKNLRGFPKDPFIHSDSAKGRKQPQRMPVIPIFKRGGKDMPVTEVERIATPQKEVNTNAEMDKWHEEQGYTKVSEGHWQKGGSPKVTEVKVSAIGEKKPSKLLTAAGRVGAFALKEAKAGYQYGEKYLREKREAAKEARITELRDVDHPAVRKRDKLEAEVAKLEERISANVGDEDDNFEKLEEAKQKLADAEEEIENLDLTTFTDGQLKALAVREKGNDAIFSFGGNKYEEELLRRVAYRKDLDKKLRDAQREKKEEPLFDF